MRLYEILEGLSSSLGQLTSELRHLPKLAKYTFCGILFENQKFVF